jgi:hypothetical protein
MRAAAALFTLLLVSSATPQTAPRTPSPTEPVMIHVYRDHFEVAGSRFTSADELRDLLRRHAFGVGIRECGVDEKLRELEALIAELFPTPINHAQVNC